MLGLLELVPSIHRQVAPPLAPRGLEQGQGQEEQCSLQPSQRLESPRLVGEPLQRLLRGGAILARLPRIRSQEAPQAVLASRERSPKDFHEVEASVVRTAELEVDQRHPPAVPDDVGWLEVPMAQDHLRAMPLERGASFANGSVNRVETWHAFRHQLRIFSNHLHHLVDGPPQHGLTLADLGHGQPVEVRERDGHEVQQLEIPIVHVGLPQRLPG
mmetsp:Transcript_137518/g.439411  ORF Transcript_137518/g.439411 Transcript_137518/m.439411 type:complete len:215 (+) Transcript_137518:114-758(+)